MIEGNSTLDPPFHVIPFHSPYHKCTSSLFANCVTSIICKTSREESCRECLSKQLPLNYFLCLPSNLHEIETWPQIRKTQTKQASLLTDWLTWHILQIYYVEMEKSKA